jgi:hypothetical protein
MANQNLSRFLRTWYGPAKSPNAILTPSPHMPRELAEWHKMSTQWGGIIASHNLAVPLDDLTTEEEKITFWVENQGNWMWGFDPTDNGCTVFEREPATKPNPWTSTGKSLSTFLIEATLIEAILAAPAMKVAQDIDAAWIETEEGSSKVTTMAWNWPTQNSNIFSGEQWLALVRPGASEGLHDVTLAATTPDALLWAHSIPNTEWESYMTAQQNSITVDPLPW